MFRDKIGRIVEVYIDNMVVKSKQEDQHIDDHREVFEVLQQHKLLLITDKCVSKVGAGKFLGYMITSQGIEVNLDQIKPINSLHTSWNPKELQKLIGMAAALNRFIFRLANRCCPFFQLFHKWKDF